MHKLYKFLFITLLLTTNFGCASVASKAVKNSLPTVDKTSSKTEVEELTYFQDENEELRVYTTSDLEQVRVAPPPERVLGEDGSKQTWLDKKEAAPFAGVLINPEGMAYILSEYEASQLRANAALIRQRELDAARMTLETGQIQLNLNATRQKGNVLLRGRDKENARLRDINSGLRNNKSKKIKIVLYTIGGLIVGGAAGTMYGIRR